jgi:hypothetical protein
MAYWKCRTWRFTLTERVARFFLSKPFFPTPTFRLFQLSPGTLPPSGPFVVRIAGEENLKVNEHIATVIDEANCQEMRIGLLLSRCT